MSDVTNDQVNIEDFHKNTFEPIEEVVETPKDEPQQPVQEIKEETLTKEVVEEKKVDETLKEPFDAAKHYQSIADKRLAELEREKIKLEQAEEKLRQYEQPKVEVEEIPVEPIMPANYDETEAITNPDSPSGKFLEADRKWNRYIGKQVLLLKTQLEQERKSTEETNKQAAYKAHILGEIQRVSGVDVKKAEQIWDNYSTLKKDEDFLKDVVEFQLWKDSRVNPDAQKKITELDQRNERMKQPLPPGVLPGKADDQKSPDELFNQSLENQRGSYSLK